MSDNNKVYGFMYNSCVEESSGDTVSLHFDRDNAKKALWKHMKTTFMKYKDYKKYCHELGHPASHFGWMEDWYIHEFEILP